MTSCCVKFAKFILCFINMIFAVLGAVIIGMSAYLLTNKDAFGTSDILNNGVLTVGIIFGSAILGTALFGCIGACKAEGCCGKFFLTIYSTIIMVVVIAEIAGGALVLASAGKLDDLDNKDLDKATDYFEQQVGKFINTTYSKCCVGGKFKDSDIICQQLQNVLAANSQPCASTATFKTACLNFLKKYMSPMGIGLIAVAVIELLCLGGACHVLCWAKKADNKAQKPAFDPSAPVEHGQAGGDLAYGASGTSAPLAAGSYS